MVVRGLRGMKDGMSTLAEPAMDGEMLDEEELRPPTLDDYPVGSIVRMKLKDFLTYSHVEFECGPSFNFVLGPNGSGKSSLVSAICIGLAGDLKSLFRATKIEGFIRHGCNRAIVEIELRGKGANRTHTIRRTIKDSTSEWKVDGQTSTITAVKKLVKELHIEIDNLCNFLPQERVHAFAQLSPNERLKETMSTIGGAKMVEQYEQLSTLRLQETELTVTCERDGADIEDLERRNDRLRPDVERYLKRDEIVQNINVINRKRPWIEYNHARDEFMTVKQERKHAITEMKRLRDADAPRMDRMAYDIIDEQTALKDELEKQRKKLCQTRDKLKTKCDDNAEAADDIRREITEVQSRVQSKKKELRKAEDLLRVIEQTIAAGNPADNLDTIRKMLIAASAEFRECESAFSAVDSELLDIISKKERVFASGQKVNARIKKLQDLREQKIAGIRRFAPQVASALDWIRNNLARFQDKVFDPLMMEINVTDPRYVDAVEAIIPKWLQLAFVVQNTHDYEVLATELRDRQNLKINVINFSHLSLDKYQSPMSNERLREFGFDGYARDFITAPDPVLVAICEHTRAHMFPIALGNVSGDVAARADVRHYIANNVRCSSKASSYGARESSERMSAIPKARNLKASEDTTELDELQAHLETLKLQYNSLEAEVQNLSTLKEQHTITREAAVGKKHELLTQKRAAVAAIKKYQQSLLTKENLIGRIEMMRKEASVELATQELHEKLQQTIEEGQEHVAKLKDIVLAIVENMVTCEEVIVRQVHAQISLTQIEEAMRESNEAVKQAELAFKRLDKQFDKMKATAKTKLAMAEEACPAADPVFQKFAALPDTLDEIDALLAQETAKAALNLDTDESVVLEFDQRRRVIEERREVYDANRKKLAATTRELETIRGDWEPTLDSLTEKISERFAIYFERLGCAGQVQVDKKDNYSSWGIDILVKFRDAEQLAPLTAHRQSGGERSVTIMLYLMSLQHFSQAPFRVVDEINQGMDPRNERLVHKQIVRTVCESEDRDVVVGSTSSNAGHYKPHSQYFLITPKLLPDLIYHPKMRILAVYNGEYVPEPDDWSSCYSQSWIQKQLEDQGSSASVAV